MRSLDVGITKDVVTGIRMGMDLDAEVDASLILNVSLSVGF